MLKRKYVGFISSLAIVSVLAGSLLYYSMVRAQGVGEYSPWADINDDGRIDMRDVYVVARKFGTSGTPFVTKAGLTYDSGWVDITDKAGQYFNIAHNLNSTDVIVDITGKTTVDGGAHQKHYGLTGYTPGWNRAYGGTESEEASCVIRTADGGYALTGGTLSFVPGHSVTWLVKTDADGDMLWNKTYMETLDNGAASMVQTSDGGYALTGAWAPSYFDREIILIRTDANGNLLWNKTYGGNEAYVANSVVQTGDGGYALGGYVCWVPLGTNLYEGFLMKTDADGNQLWNKTYVVEAGYTVAFSVVQTGDGGYTLAGCTGPAIGPGPAQNLDGFLIRTDSDGNQLWDEIYGGAGDDREFRMVQTADGGYALAGKTNSFGAGGYDAYLIKTDSNGDMQWNRTYGGTNDDYSHFVVQTSDDGYALAGATLSFGAGGWDFWLVKTDSKGNQQWNKSYGGSNDDQAQSLTQADDGGYAVAGYTLSFGAGNRDFWLVKTCVESGLAWTDSTPNTITLYRGATDPYWNYVRVRIWKIKETP